MKRYRPSVSASFCGLPVGFALRTAVSESGMTVFLLADGISHLLRENYTVRNTAKNSGCPRTCLFYPGQEKGRRY